MLHIRSKKRGTSTRCIIQWLPVWFVNNFIRQKRLCREENVQLNKRASERYSSWTSEKTKQKRKVVLTKVYTVCNRMILNIALL